MKSVVLKLPPNAKFHLGEYAEDQSTALFNTATIIHSDVLFGAFVSALSQIDEAKISAFRKYFEEGKIAFSSAFYRIEIKDKAPVYLLPKPVSINLYQLKNSTKFEVKKFKKIAFISKGVWEKGISPEIWFDESGECVMPNKETVCLRSEIDDEKFELYQKVDEEKVNLTPIKEDNELYTRSVLEVLNTKVERP